MNKALIAAVVAVVGACAQAEIVQIDISGLANKDVVFEAGVRSKADKFGESDVAHHAFMEQGLPGADGLPVTRQVPSPSDFGEYLLALYNHKNVIEVGSHVDAPKVDCRIEIPEGKYRRFGLLVAAVDGDASFTIKLHFVDGTEETYWWEADDWYQPTLNRGNCVPAVANMDRMDVKDNKVEDANHFQLYEFILKDIDESKIITAISIGNEPNRFDSSKQSWGCVFAINGERVDSK